LGETDGSRIVSCLWWLYRVTRDHILEGSHDGHQGFRRVYWHPYSSCLFLLAMHSPRPIFTGSAIPYYCSGVQLVPVPSGTFRLRTGYFMVVVPGKYGTHSKYDSLNSINFQITGSINC